MSSVATPPAKLDDPYADKILADLESLHLISSDGVPMESGWHVKNMTLLINQIEHHFRDRDDFYVGGNMFIYYSPQQARNRDFRGPDFFFVNDVNRYPLRKYWVVWEENLTTPDVVIELSSESTKDEDHGPKFRIYRDTLRVGNYFIYDPETRLLEGWRLEKGKKYVPIRPEPLSRRPTSLRKPRPPGPKPLHEPRRTRRPEQRPRSNGPMSNINAPTPSRPNSPT
jgi:Uma2 family endonuclease